MRHHCGDMSLDHSKDLRMTSHGTPAAPIAVKETKVDSGQYVDWEYDYITWELGHYVPCLQTVLRILDKVIDRMVVRTPSKVHHVFYFDITAQFAKQMEEMRKSAERPPHPEGR